MYYVDYQRATYSNAHKTLSHVQYVLMSVCIQSDVFTNSVSTSRQHSKSISASQASSIVHLKAVCLAMAISTCTTVYRYLVVCITLQHMLRRVRQLYGYVIYIHVHQQPQFIAAVSDTRRIKYFANFYCD